LDFGFQITQVPFRDFAQMFIRERTTPRQLGF
jgi:hypothetical protein